MSNKIYLIGDVHLSLGFPNNADKWFKTHKQYFESFLIPLLKEKVKPGDIIVQLGDLFDNRNIIPIHHLNYALYIVEEISRIAPLHILVGNHDMYNKSAGEINTLKPFKYIPNVFIYDMPQKINFNNRSILMMPFIEHRLEQIKYLKEYSGCDYLFCHSDLNGAKMHLTSVANRNADKIDSLDFIGYKKVMTGHIHIRQVIDNITFVGSIFQMDRNDYKDQKGIFIIDTETGEEQFIENNISPVFQKLSIITEQDVEKLDDYRGSKDYIDLAISNNLLISNRKLRRKLEAVLESGGFASIEYIDDIVQAVNEDVDSTSEEPIDESKIDISIQLDYGDYIKEYIMKQKYENDKFREGVVDEYDEIIKIYNENYINKK